MGRPRSNNKWSIDNNIALTILKHGGTCVDIKDLDKVKDFKWFTKKSYKSNNYYVYSHLTGNKKLLLHRFLLNITDSKLCVDHINGDTLDNRRCNLRIATKGENNRNAKKNKRGKTLYKGVIIRPSGRYGVYIQYNNKPLCLGTYDDIKTAAEVYNKKAKEIFGEFARLNKIGDKDENLHTNE